MRELKYPAIYKHFKNKYYATMGISKPMCVDEYMKYLKDNNLELWHIKYLWFEHTESNKTIPICLINGEYRHFSQTNKELVMYKSLYSDKGDYARELDMFLSEVDKEKYPNVKQQYRFEEVNQISDIVIKIRGFEVVEDKYRKYPNRDIKIPKRSTKNSAGYDICTPVKIVIPAGGISEAIQTDIKAYMLEDEVLEIYPRSSLGFKKGLMLINTVGIIDSDYYSNLDNDGNIGFKLKNLSDKEVVIEAGEKIMQGVFKKYLKVDNDDVDEIRSGGIGSTGK